MPDVPAVTPTATPAAARAPIELVLDAARWAPSGDNTQPWRFERLDAHAALLHGHDTREHCVYDLDGRPSQIAIGALIETAAIAASAHGWRLEASRRPGPDERPTYELRLTADGAVLPDPLAAVIERRSVQRRPFRRTALTAAQKQALQASVGSGFAVRWIEGGARRAMAGLLFRSARLRLTTPEAWRVHRDIIDWGARFSEERVPDQALGANPLVLPAMRFALADWKRVQFANRFLAGTWMPRIELDLLPALGCAAHFVILAPAPALTVEANVAAGRAMQRFWLTATALGLQLQPEMTPLIFARYAREGRRFSQTPGAFEAAAAVATGFERIAGADALARGVFVGRVGLGAQARSRSLRRRLETLFVSSPDTHR
ncbi:molybdopterin biosynthesis protein MoeY [Rubrivivax gelatinosus]|uniref:Molybdopterin biosynthesis protein MoeY n=1 Tax=Rubrivivax gelatinosus TaxID=28068 RepID=A0ABS1E053_RUBGE|nr:molybdopterin biosynthesis protein MoeY [Rubrivivax gelatinosus]MBK1612249.1 molybdopterin biosynthesis protein MoeY [Rubrivivax gelatinosus]MBK1714315.1 molybdopterin biosynthesis protein MoeY [Rubrivivax gelatinosus]